MRASCPTGRLSLTVLSVALSSSNTWMSCKGKVLERKRQKDNVILVLPAEATHLGTQESVHVYYVLARGS